MAVLRHHVDPRDVYAATGPGRSQGVVTEGGRTLRSGGIAGLGSDGVPVGDTLTEQLAATLENVRKVLVAAGATPDQVVRVQWAVVGLDEAAAEAVAGASASFFGGRPAASLHGVAALADSRILVEVEVTAVIESAG